MDKQYEEVKDKDNLLAIIIRADFSSEKVVFFTPRNFSQQLGFLPHKRGDVLQAHIHKEGKREITLTREVLFVRKGEVKINLFTERKEYVGSVVLKKGDVILLVSGGHEFKMLEDTEMIEVKQGPYLDIDKERFEGIEK